MDPMTDKSKHCNYISFLNKPVDYDGNLIYDVFWTLLWQSSIHILDKCVWEAHSAISGRQSRAEPLWGTWRWRVMAICSY